MTISCLIATTAKGRGQNEDSRKTNLYKTRHVRDEMVILYECGNYINSLGRDNRE